jgi:hypothetical protein
MGKKLLQLALMPLLQDAVFQPQTCWGGSAGHVPLADSWGCQELQVRGNSGTFCVSTDTRCAGAVELES